MFEHAFVNTSLKSSILFFPERKQRGIDRSYLLHILKNEGYFCFVSRPSDLLGKGGQRKVCFKGSTLILFQLQKSACESKKSVFEDESARREFSRPLKSTSVHRSLKSSVPSFFFFFFYYYYYSIYVFRVFEYSYRIFDGTETLGRSSFIFTRGNIFSSFPIFSGITSFYRNDLDFSLRLELRRASRRRLNLILSCFIYRFVHLIWNGMP